MGAFDSPAIIGSTSTHPTIKGQLPKIITCFSDISYLHQNTLIAEVTENINLLSGAQF